MARRSGLIRRVRAAKDYSESEDDQDSSEPEIPFAEPASSEGDSEDSESDTDNNDGSQDPSDSQGSSDDQGDSKNVLASISFGDLAAAASSLGPSLKRKRPEQAGPKPQSESRSPSPFHEAEERLAGHSRPFQAKTRTSKHAPQELSSKKAVSRKRTVIAVPKVEARDPRFSNLSGSLNISKVKQNYAFLNEYRASEMATLKEQIRSTRDNASKEKLKRELRAMEDRERARKKVDDERAVIRDHRKKEADAVRKGKKPFYLKESEVKKQVLTKRFEGMGEKKAEKVMERRRKKKAQRERRSMPATRREPE